MRKFFSAILCCMILTGLHAQRQDSSYLQGEWLTSKEGLSQGMISSIIQDKQGYMWFATKDGLNKYDGYKITVYRHNPDDPYSLPDNYVTQIYEDENGNFWAGTLSRGIYIFERSTERFYPVFTNATGSSNSNITFAMWFHKGRMLIQKSDGLWVYDISRFRLNKNVKYIADTLQAVFNYNQLQKNKAYSINQGSKPAISWFNNGELLIRFRDTIIYAQSIAPGDWVLKGLPTQMFGVSKKELSNVSLDFSPSQTGMLYYCYNRKLYQLNLKTGNSKALTGIIEKADVPCLKIQTLADGTVYLFYSSGWVYNPASGELKRIAMKREDDAFTAMSTSICRDNTGNVWYGTAGYGIFKSDVMKPPFNVHKTYDNAEVLLSIYGTSWLQYKQHLSRFIYTNFQNHVRDKHGNYWFCNNLEDSFMRPRLICFNPVTKSLRKYDLLNNCNYVNTVFFRDRQNGLWVFSEEGLNKKMLYRFNDTNGLATITASFPVQQKEDNQYPFVLDWLQDGNGFFWFATVQGLFRYDPATNEWKQWKNILGNTTSLPSDMLFTICSDPYKPLQYLWAGTNGAGFCRFEIATGKCMRFTDKDGLPNNVVYGMLNDSMGNIWLSTNHGLSCFNTTNKLFRNFTKEDNLCSDEFNRTQYAKLPDGQLMFGGIDGYILFNPTDILKPRPPVPVVFTGLSISNKPVDWKKDSTVINAPAGYAKQVTLHPGQNMFTISFASLDYRNNEKKFYKYRLDGFDGNWTNPSNKNEATYTNLNPGTYLFHVTGTNTDGVWNDKDITIPIVVLPYWYQTIWFKIIVALLITGAIYGWYRYRLQQHLRLLNVRNRIAGDLHDEIGSTLSSISLSSTIVQHKLKEESPEVQNLLQQISTNTDTMMEAMSDIVWAINTRNDNFESVINRIRAFAVEMLEPQGVAIHFSITDAALHQNLDMVQRKNCYLLFKEAINNAAKYADCKNVWVTIDMHGGKAAIEIKDDGKGFIYTKGNYKENGFGGNGLPGMHKRAAEIKGELGIESSLGIGTVIKLRFEV